ncbi:MAG: CotH kinase family protein [Proteobacteria bacterium]|nr:CotH kinase family protein [Pseudomonadota bacterium]
MALPGAKVDALTHQVSGVAKRLSFCVAGLPPSGASKRPKPDNGDWVQRAPAPPHFSHKSGLYPEPFLLTLSNEDADPEGDKSAIYYSIDGSYPHPELMGNGRVFQYSAPITIKDRNGEKNLMATPENSLQMYAIHSRDGGDRLWTQSPPYIPSDEDVPKAAVISAIVIDAHGRESQVATATFFIGDNLKNYKGRRVISIVTDPLNLFDAKKGIFVRGHGEFWYSDPLYNFVQRGIAWERMAFLEIFDKDRDVELKSHVGIKVRGGLSRSHGQKSLNIYFRERYNGAHTLDDHPLLPEAKKSDGTTLQKYKSFMLRNGGHDQYYALYRDAFCQYLVRDRSVATQSADPIVLYLNGEYWGPYSLMERYSDNHTEYVYGVEKENVISIKDGEMDDGWPGEEQLYHDMVGMHELDMADDRNYEAFCNLFDIDNFIDYWATEIYLFNQDWPHRNFRLWRTRNIEEGNPFGDTKWRWQFFDLDCTLGFKENGSTRYQGRDAFETIYETPYKNDHGHVKLFKALLENTNFKNSFLTALMDLYNVNFHPDNYGPILDTFVQKYRPLAIYDHFDRWHGRSLSYRFDKRTNAGKAFLDTMRSFLVTDLLPKHFGLGLDDLFDVAVEVRGAPLSTVSINTVRPSLRNGTWTGKYYATIPVDVRVETPDGYRFDGWEIEGGTALEESHAAIKVLITGDAVIAAKFVEDI